MPVKILAFDTATNACSVALQVNQHIFFRHQVAPSQHAKLMLPMIQSVLVEANIQLQDLNAIAFGSGPGSFMGVRLATAMAQGLAFGANIPLISISTLQTLAQTAFAVNQAVKTYLVAWDAKMHELYWGCYTANEAGILQPTQHDALCTPAAIDIHTNIEVPFSLAGNAWSVYEEQIPNPLLSKAIIKQTDLYPEARAMLTIAVSKYLHNEIISPENAHPHYLRHHVVHTTTK